MKNPVKKFQEWAQTGRGMREPPQPRDTFDNLGTAPGQGATEPVEQINFKAPIGTKARIKRLAAADKVSMLTVFKSALDLYESDQRKRREMS